MIVRSFSEQVGEKAESEGSQRLFFGFRKKGGRKGVIFDDFTPFWGVFGLQ